MPRSKMEVVRLGVGNECHVLDVAAIPREVTDWDRRWFAAITSIALTTVQEQLVRTPPQVLHRQEEILAVHWHPEFVPMALAMERVRAMFPNSRSELIIPTQHNVLMALNGYAGVEVDCYAHGFNRKVQLLLHFNEANVAEAGVLSSMLAHTFRYRSSQLFELLDSLTEKAFEARRQEAAGETGADADMVEFCTIHARKLRRLIDENWGDTPRDMMKNKLVRNYFNCLRETFGDRWISRAQVYLKAVKHIVKRNFSLQFFYRTSEVIEEARALGAGIVIPHPEQFWPILLAGYDVDGIEVWNPQSQEYTEFLINAVHRQNQTRGRASRPLLIFMGDDCHMGEKLGVADSVDPVKALREVGLQPGWDDLSIRKSLILGGVSRAGIIEEYKARLG
ncbi:MAG: hypothetical protein AB7E47_16535 [Desulfovibrionaceae bacterium]